MITPSLPTLTVIIPCYNAADHISAALRMLRRQTHAPEQIIIVDDGSTDGSPDLLRREPGITLIECKENGGAAVARNVGLRQATGDYIHFLDIDDRINSHFYEEMLRAITETGAETACCGMIHQAAPSKTQIFRRREVVSDPTDRLRVTWVGKWGYAVRYLFPLRLIKDHNLTFEPGRLMEDLPFSFAALWFTQSIVTVPGAEYLYVRSEGSSMQTRSKEAHLRRRRDRKHARERILAIAAEQGIDRIPGVTSDRLPYLIRKLRQRLFAPRQDSLTEEL